MEKSYIYKIKIACLCLFVFSLAFEHWDPWGIKDVFTITKMAGFLYAGLAIFRFNKNFKISTNKVNVLLLFTLWLWLVVVSLINTWGGGWGRVNPFHISFLLNIIFFWLVTNDFVQNPKIIKYCLLSYILGISLVSILAPLGIGVELRVLEEESRIYFFGTNPNDLGNWAVIACLFIIAMIFNPKQFFGKKGLFLLLFIPSILILIAMSGSRGAFLVLVAGLAVYFLIYKTTTLKKLIVIILGLALSIYIINFIFESNTLHARIIESIRYQDTGNRINIWLDALKIYFENPFFGVGGTGYEKEMLSRYYYYMDTHNLFIYILVAGGVIGFALFISFYTRILSFSFRSYQALGNSLSLSLFIVLSGMFMKDGGVLVKKIVWLLMSYIAGTGIIANNKKYKDT